MRILMLLLLGAASSVCMAQTPYIVTTTADSGAGSLRAAITSANGVGFSSITFNLTLPATITINSALPRVVGDLNISGPGARNLTISGGGGSYRFLTVGDYSGGSPTSGFLSIENLSIEDFAGGAMDFADAPNGTNSSIYAIRLGIRNCTASNGGGGFLVRGGSMVAQECEISGCGASGSSGGGAVKMVPAGTGYGSSLLFCTTLYGNSAAGNGGAIEVATGISSGSCQLIGCTVANNSAGGTGGGIYSGSAIITLRNTIIGDNTAASGPDGAGPAAFTSQGYNLVENPTGMSGSAGTGDIVNQDPQLGALQDNGGQTDTCDLPTSSPCVDSASLTGLGQMTDARGIARPWDIASVTNIYDGTDIGAFELKPGYTGNPTVTCVGTDNMSSEATPSSDHGVFTFYFSPATTQTVQLLFTMGGTADMNPGSDYFLLASIGSLVMQGGYYTYDVPAGVSQAAVNLDPVDDTSVEGATPEWAVMTLYPQFGQYTIGYAANPQIAIVDNDVSGTPTLSVGVPDSMASEANAATDTAQWAIVMAPAPASGFTLNFTISGTAAMAGGTDYNLSATGGTLTYSTGPTGTISVGTGTTTVLVTLTAVDDSAIEGGTPETAIITLNTGTGYGLGTSVSGTLNIVDDDIPPTPVVTVSATDNTAAEGTPAFDTGEFSLVLSPVPTSPMTINFTMGGAAGLTGDYTLSATGGSLTYTTGPTGTIDVGTGTTAVTITMTAVDNATVEALVETAVLTLNTGTGYTLGTSVSDTVSITDDDGLPVQVITVGLLGGQAGTPYSENITATGGAAPYTWSIAAGNLPPGVTLGSSTTNVVTVSGTPTSAGTFNFTIDCADAITSDAQAFTVVIAPSLGGGSGGGGGGSGGGGCATGHGSAWMVLAAMLALGYALARRARRGDTGDRICD